MYNLIFSDLVEDTIKVFMDNFSVVGHIFERYLCHFSEVLKRCEDCNLVLEVDRAKVEVIERLPPPISVKGVRSFLGHAGFYWRFIKDFLKISHPF